MERKYFSWLRECLFPLGCPSCGGDLFGPQEAWQGLCGPCRAALERELEESRAEARCGVCGRPLVSERGRCFSCREGGSRPYDGVRALFPYRGKHRKLLAAYKFGKNLALGNFFAEKIIEALAAAPGAVVVPVPPRPGKMRRMGWDQVEHLAKLLERARIPVSRCIERLPSQSQKELDGESRRTNLKGRIVARPKRAPPPAAILLDDVITTGATMEACAYALKEAGVEKACGLCLFWD